MALLQSTIELPYDAHDNGEKKAILQIKTAPIVKQPLLEKYRIDVSYYRLQDDGSGFVNPKFIKNREPINLPYEVIDGLRNLYKNGRQITSHEEEHLLELVLYDITVKDPIYFSQANVWRIVKHDELILPSAEELEFLKDVTWKNTY